MQLPLFPLPIFLLPAGVTRLRIFEQRYLNMVKRAQQTQGFAIQLKQSGQEALSSNVVSWVEIVNFDQSDDGLLTIDVRCHALLRLVRQHVNHDGLIVAEVEPHPHWQPDETAQLPILTALGEVITHHPLLNELYPLPIPETATWVYGRWLELLPVSAKQKQLFFAQDSFSAAKKFVDAIVMN